MNRLATIVAIALTSLALLAGCDGAPEPAADATATPAATSAATRPLEGYDAMPAEDSGEAKAAASAVRELDTLSEISEEQRAALKADQRLIAYLVRAEMDGQVALFEVRAEGLAHNIYSYPRAFDSGSIIWMPAANAPAGGREAASEGERRAVAAVDEMLLDAFPEGGFTVEPGGYRFAFLAQGIEPVHVEIAADGAAVISVSR